MELQIPYCNKLFVDNEYKIIKTLPDEFISKGIISTIFGYKDVELMMRKKRVSLEHVKGIKIHEIYISDNDNLFTLDINGLMLPVIKDNSQVETFILYTYEVDVREAFLPAEYFIYVGDDIYQRVGQRTGIQHRLGGLIQLPHVI